MSVMMGSPRRTDEGHPDPDAQSDRGTCEHETSSPRYSDEEFDLEDSYTLRNSDDEYESKISSPRSSATEYNRTDPLHGRMQGTYDATNYYPYDAAEDALDSMTSSPPDREESHESTDFAPSESEGTFEVSDVKSRGKEACPLGDISEPNCKELSPKSSDEEKGKSIQPYPRTTWYRCEKKGPPPLPFLAIQLEFIRRDGNDRLKKNDYDGALARYTACITKGQSSLLDPSTSPTCKMLLKRILKLAYSNRAQMHLSGKLWEEVLNDTAKALKFDRHHIQSLIRRGKALHSLQQYKQACQAFGAALDRNPNNLQVAAALHESMTSHHQSVSGKYDLSHFLLYSGPPPECSDYVGPVVIKEVAHAGRGLFVTKKVEAGSLLIVCNALAISSISSSSTNSDLSVRLARLIMKQLKASKRWAHQMYYLTSGKPEQDNQEIPDMKMFIPGSDWCPDPSKDVSLSFLDIARRVTLNTFDASRALFDGQKLESEGKTEPVISSGVWVLPSFLNHSCVPSTGIMFVGKAMFIRAARNLEPGEELTTSYTACYKPNRRKSIRKWSFECRCERCLQDAMLEPYLDELRRELDANYAHFSSKKSTKSEKMDAVIKTIDMIGRVESAIESLPLVLDAQRKNWVRVSFMAVYSNKFHMARTGTDLGQTIQALQQLAAIEQSIYGGGVQYASLRTSSQLLGYVRRKFGKNSEDFRQTLEQVLKVFRTALGDMEEQFFMQLIKIRYSKKHPRHLTWLDYSK
ncbi:protein MpATXR13 [Marchantia polymorpha subsp. ruderalis]|uniref:SET domain-containing protein n=1 Tax=Marchantia polymorpha TaxID=3197 RepID=A0A2R6X9T0_MARPO|nr:hypothetical protein MARPO_0028s0125 [Marchantia polymorpha]PTQ42833.1 hypothetical protein MARPO_0028s0125 [Marchantia polymorpha]BBN00564.1 hypothetical protein Mp_2g00260 [Marchantia polymorpha subsp. ruderalis]BBN00565.1 hypothetical protein Mp_2g00260 [Marchantia polymorpha subsp. ruderalis]|eukprot:PTQ42832.1 hypothetical protein MARPO_0028s0125 [Marchantia polymorpha]